MSILAIGTSIPEIMTHVVGSYQILQDPSKLNELSALVIGTNIGSDIFQQNFLIGVIALIGVIIVERKNLFKDVGGLIAATVILMLFSLNGLISRVEGFILFGGYLLYLWYLKTKGIDHETVTKRAVKDHLVMHSAILIACFAVMTFAADRMLHHATILVETLHISASFFGVIMLGVAAAFPELITSIVAVYKKRARISAGILIGSNITNPMFALGLGALISTYTVPQSVVWFDMPVKIATALLLLWFLWKGRLQKKQAAVLIILYLLYLLFRNILFPVDVVMG